MATISGTAGADTLSGEAGGDVFTGGPGFDLFFIGSGASNSGTGLADITAIDTITDWSAEDRLLFAGGQPGYFGSLFQSTAGDYQDAYNRANTGFGSGFQYAAIQVSDDVFVFAFGPGAAVKLTNTTLADVQRFNFTSGSLDGASAGLVEIGSNGPDARQFALGGDQYDGAGGDDTVSGGLGNDTLAGGDGDDQVYGGLENDVITGGAGRNYLRGDDGDDRLTGGVGFDDISGNMGNDNITGGEGDDWVVGGKDEDVIFGEAGNDIVYGNLGNDTVGGGVGNDLVRGGQGDDLVRGDDGNDILAGDRGADTMDGGIGADIFITFSETGTDKVNDFNAGEGDRVQLDPGTQFTLSQIDNDTVIDMGGGNRMVLVNVLLQNLPDGWIYYGG